MEAPLNGYMSVCALVWKTWQEKAKKETETAERQGVRFKIVYCPDQAMTTWRNAKNNETWRNRCSEKKLSNT